MSEQRYLVTARKYRPQRFEEIVAQGHVSETLKNAITLDRLAHAYLFSGPRGVGKTTAARILAKAINCTSSLEERDGGEPCRSCESCRTFEEGRSMNIIEIDAASNNRVEDIRELRDTVLIPPQGSRKKVYIIDEVHMLSNAAFNALLKTLEEPPPYALFIFATTEPNKVLPTILSRCQRFDFRRIAVPEIVAHLETICTTENIQADEASLMLIAHKGDGALRDSLSAFDQAVSLCGTSLKYPELAQAFGVVDVELFFEVTQCVVAGNSGGLLSMVDRIIRQGYDLQEFLIGLASHLRNLLVANTMQNTSLIELAEAVKQQYATESKQHSETDLLRLLMVVADGEEKLKTSAQPRLQLELTLLKMAAMAHAVDLKKALDKLDKLESGVSDGTISVSSNTSSEQSGAAPASSAAQPPPAQKVVAKVVVSDASTPSPAPGGPTTSLASASQGTSSAASGQMASGQIETTQPITAQPITAQPTTTQPTTAQPTSAQVATLVTMPPPAPEASSPEIAASSEISATPAILTSTAPSMPLAGTVESGGDIAVAEMPEVLDAPTGIATEPPLAQTASIQIDEPVYEADESSQPFPPFADLPPEVEQPQVNTPTPVQAAPDDASQSSYRGLFGAPALRKVQNNEMPSGDDASSSAEGNVATLGAPSAELAEINKVWPEFLTHVKTERIHVSALLQHTRPIQLKDETLVMAVPDEFHKRMLTNQQDFLLDHLCNFVMEPVEMVSFVIDMAGSEELKEQETADEIDPYEYMQKKRNESPIIRAIFDEFGGEMVW
ncbi:MAG: DNA polymerase III subunit gamma/tau [Rhodothermales bacterium]